METATRNYGSLPMAMPGKGPASGTLYPISRVAGSPPEISDVSTTTGSSSGDFDCSSSGYAGVDIIDTLQDRMGNAFDPSRLEKGVAKQAQL
jgi:hypothetical protein